MHRILFPIFFAGLIFTNPAKARSVVAGEMEDSGKPSNKIHDKDGKLHLVLRLRDPEQENRGNNSTLQAILSSSEATQDELNTEVSLRVLPQKRKNNSETDKEQQVPRPQATLVKRSKKGGRKDICPKQISMHSKKTEKPFEIDEENKKKAYEPDPSEGLQIEKGEEKEADESVDIGKDVEKEVEAFFEAVDDAFVSAASALTNGASSFWSSVTACTYGEEEKLKKE